MAFKKVIPAPLVPESPDKLFLELPRRKFPDVMPHQREIMRTYAQEAQDKKDVALQLPTGSGKTLVGLLIAEWRRRKNKERVVYLCPTRQLVNQVVEQAEEKYGLTVHGFTGSAKNYQQTKKTEYRNADRIAVSTYNSLFNSNPFFKDADIIILDDSHAAENYVASLWTIQIDRTNPKHKAAHSAVANILRRFLEPHNFVRLSGTSYSEGDRMWVDKLPSPDFQQINQELSEVLDSHASSSEFSNSWSMIKGNLMGCHLYFSSKEILLRPLIPPTWSHAPFANPKQRIFMSATLGPGGDLERLMGRKDIHRIPTPEGWEEQGVGRRFFIFPSMSLTQVEETELRHELMGHSKRSLVLVPNSKIQNKIKQEISNILGFQTFNAEDIEKSKKIFTEASPAVAIVANRYDGIDFPGDECRLLFIDSLPKTTNIQERFLMSRMGAGILFNERIQTRILQAIGRCTRSLEDYSAVVALGEELTNYLGDIKKRQFFPPELQAEIKFGVEQSKDTSLNDIVENFKIFLENGENWEQVNQQIVDDRKTLTQQTFPALNELTQVVSFEIEYQKKLWNGDFESAFHWAEKVIGGLTASALKGYRALWHYLAGSAANLAAIEGVAGLESKAKTQFTYSKNATDSLPWLVKLARFQGQSCTPAKNPAEDNSLLMSQVEGVEEILYELGTVHDRKFAQREKIILEGLSTNTSFEEAHKLLGEMLGFSSGKIESPGSPDPWWLIGNLCFVFEDHAGAGENCILDIKKSRQVASHPNWMRENVEESNSTDILPVLVTPARKAHKDAFPHLKDVALWPLNEFREWAQKALAVIRELRVTFSEPGDLVWRASAADKFIENELDARILFSKLKKEVAKDHLIEVS